MNVLDFQLREHPRPEHPRGQIIAFPLTRVLYDREPANPLPALTGATVAIFGVTMLAVVAYLVAA